MNRSLVVVLVKWVAFYIGADENLNAKYALNSVNVGLTARNAIIHQIISIRSDVFANAYIGFNYNLITSVALRVPLKLFILLSTSFTVGRIWCPQSFRNNRNVPTFVSINCRKFSLFSSSSLVGSMLAYWTKGSSSNHRSSSKWKHKNFSPATSSQQISGKNSESN